MVAVAYTGSAGDLQRDGACPPAGGAGWSPLRAGSQHRPAASAARRRPGAATYRRRRLLALALAGATLVPAAHLGAALLRGGPLTAPGGRGASLPVASHAYVVRPGDTVWTIAHRLQPSGDERPLVDSLTAELGGASLRPGQSLRLP